MKRHPEGPVLVNSDLSDLSPGITVSDHLVLKALKAFTKGSSPGGFQLRAQHLLDAVSGFRAPVAQDYLHQLVNFLLSDKAPHLVAPWYSVGHRLPHYIRKMEVFSLSWCVKP